LRRGAHLFVGQEESERITTIVMTVMQNKPFGAKSGKFENVRFKASSATLFDRNYWPID
jgi:hypothetical protein